MVFWTQNKFGGTLQALQGNEQQAIACMIRMVGGKGEDLILRQMWAP